MTPNEILERIRNMPENERRELVQQILDEFTEYDDELTPEQTAELDRRAEEFSRNPQSGIPWEQVQAEMHERLAARRKLTAEQIAELDRRAERALANLERCRPLDNVVADIERRSGQSQRD